MRARCSSSPTRHPNLPKSRRHHHIQWRKPMSHSSEIDVHEELSGAAIGPSHKALGILITLITLFDGYDTFNPAYVIHYVMKPWGLVPSQAGLLVSSGLVGFLFGAICHGMI